MTTRTHAEFFRDFLHGLDITPTTANVRTLAAVSIFESSQGDNAWWNPLAVIQPWPGAVPYNTFGDGQHVWVYASFADGVHATVQLFQGSHWDEVRTLLGSGRTRGPMLDAFSRAYSWADVEFRHLFTTAQLDARRSHPLQGPA